MLSAPVTSAMARAVVLPLVVLSMSPEPIQAAQDSEERKVVSAFWENDQRLWREFLPLAIRGYWAPGPCKDLERPNPFRTPDETATLTAACKDTRSDKYYTNGLKISELHLDPASAENSKCDFRHVVKVLKLVPPFRFSARGRWAAGWVFGQSLFTPREEIIESPGFDRNDRPFGAWTYLGITTVVGTRRWQQTVELDGGVTGPPAGGREVQTAAHWLINRFGADAAAHPAWSPQIPFGVRAQAVYQAKWQPGAVSLPLVDAGLTFHGGGAYGHIARFWNGGAFLRVGRYLGGDFGPGGSGLPPVGAHLTGRGMQRDQWKSSGIGVSDSPGPRYAYAGLDARVVSYNLFLDARPSELGSRRRDFVWDLVFGLTLPAFAITWPEHDVDPKTLTSTVRGQGGLCFPSIAWRLVRRSEEFEGQKLFGYPKAFWFGSFNLVWTPGACSRRK